MFITLIFHREMLFRIIFVLTCLIYLSFSNPAVAETCKGDKDVFPDAEALFSVKSLAISGDAQAQALLAAVYLAGAGVEPDTAKSLFWSKKSASGGG